MCCAFFVVGLLCGVCGVMCHLLRDAVVCGCCILALFVCILRCFGSVDWVVCVVWCLSGLGGICWVFFCGRVSFAVVQFC